MKRKKKEQLNNVEPTWREKKERSFEVVNLDQNARLRQQPPHSSLPPSEENYHHYHHQGHGAGHSPIQADQPQEHNEEESAFRSSSHSSSPLVTQNDVRMASVISSGTSPMSGFSQVDEDLESWQFLDAEGGGNAAGSLQELAGSLGLDGSPSIVSQGSWGVVGNMGAHQQHQHYHHPQQHQQHQQQQHQQQMLLQTPSPGPLLDHALSVSPLNGAAPFANGSPAGVGNGTAGFGFSNSPLDTRQHVSQEQFVIEALQHGQTFGVGTNAAAFLEHGSMG